MHAKEHRVATVEHAAVPGHDAAGVLDADPALDARLEEVAHHEAMAPTTRRDQRKDTA